jgi:hypothetical protein
MKRQAFSPNLWVDQIEAKKQMMVVSKTSKDTKECHCSLRNSCWMLVLLLFRLPHETLLQPQVVVREAFQLEIVGSILDSLVLALTVDLSLPRRQLVAETAKAKSGAVNGWVCDIAVRLDGDE